MFITSTKPEKNKINQLLFKTHTSQYILLYIRDVNNSTLEICFCNFVAFTLLTFLKLKTALRLLGHPVYMSHSE